MTIHLTVEPCGDRLCGATDGAAYLLRHCQPWHLRTHRICGLCMMRRPFESYKSVVQPAAIVVERHNLDESEKAELEAMGVVFECEPPQQLELTL